jgi:hypothetical protein
MSSQIKPDRTKVTVIRKGESALPDDDGFIEGDPSYRQYWLSKTPDERISAVEILRRQYYGNSERL